MFYVSYEHVGHVPEAHFKFIKETRSLNNMMPSSLMWEEESRNGRRYFGTQKRQQPVRRATAELFQQAQDFTKRVPFRFARFDGFCIDSQDSSRLCIMPDAFTVQTLEATGKHVDPLYTKPFMRYQVDSHMEYMFGDTVATGPIPKHLQIMGKFGYVSDSGKVNFEKLSQDLGAYAERLEDALRDCHNKLIELRGGVVTTKQLSNFDRSQYSLDPDVLWREAQNQINSDDESSF